MAASITITLTNICAGANHLTYSISGDKTATVRGLLSEVSDPITDAEAEAFCRTIAKMAKVGRTVAQARTLLQAGVTVNV